MHSRGQIKENGEDKTPTGPDLNGQSDCNESRTGNVVLAYIQNGLDAGDDHHVHGENFKSNNIRKHVIFYVMYKVIGVKRNQWEGG